MKKKDTENLYVGDLVILPDKTIGVVIHVFAAHEWGKRYVTEVKVTHLNADGKIKSYFPRSIKPIPDATKQKIQEILEDTIKTS